MARIEYGRSSSGQIVRVAEARRGARYTCPTCGLLLELRRGEQLEYFAHWRNLPGTKDCELFSPGDAGLGGVANAPSRRSLAEVEDAPSELGLLLAEVEGRWGLGLRLPEIPGDELGITSLSALRSAGVDVYVGRDHVSRVGALELRPGVGAARVDVAPSLQPFRTQPTGSWPGSIDRERWLLECRGLEARGVLFRLRRGEWTRLVARSGVHPGETLLVLAEERCAPPIHSELHARISNAGLEWCIWEVQLPSEPAENVGGWLARLGHELVPRPWSAALATPPRAYGEGGEPIFWVGDVPLLTLEAPQRAATTMVSFHSGTNAHSASVTASELSVAHVRVTARDAGPTRVAVAGERSASLELVFRKQPSRAEVLEQLAQTPRLRLRIGTQTFEAWRGKEHSVRIPRQEQLDVSVDLGAETARARVTVWDHGKQRTRSGLDARGVERVIADALGAASRIEVDVDSLGRVVVLPSRAPLVAPRVRGAADRLSRRDELASLASQNEPLAVPTLLVRPGGRGLAVRRVGAAALVRSRLALRRRLETGGSRP